MPKEPRMQDVIAILREHRRHIQEHGFSIQYVLGDENTPALAYTLGLTETYSRPEILVLGLPPETALGCLRNAVQLMKKTGPLLMNKPVAAILAENPVYFISVPKRHGASYALLAEDFYPAARYLQLIYPDRNSHFPWSPEYDPAMVPVQPILGEIGSFARLH